MWYGRELAVLHKMASQSQQCADRARKTVVLLRAVVRALQAMSWPGWAAAYARYLEVTVIPWVQATGEALERFAQILRAASSLQKAVSEDSPQVEIGRASCRERE